MKNRPLFFKVFSAFLTLILLLSGAILYTSFSKINAYYYTLKKNDLLNLSYTLRLKAVSLIEENKISELDKIIKNLDTDIQTRITVIDPEGAVLADSEKNPALMENHKNRPEVSEALALQPGSSIRYSSTVKEKMLYVAIPMESRGRLLGVLRLSVFVRSIDNLIKQVRAGILRITFIVILCAMLLTWLFSRSINRQAKALETAANRVASGDFSAKVSGSEIQEFSKVADSFNTMTKKINGLFTELSEQKNELNTIVSSVSEGLVVIDKDDKILFSNNSFAKLCNIPPAADKRVWEVFRNGEFAELLKKAREKASGTTAEIVIAGRFFICGITYLAHNAEVIAVFSDVSQIKQLENMKREFVANVSHELKTPLTAIKGFAETVRDGLEGQKLHYVEIIEKNADRLISIVEDLLTISELENEAYKLQLEPVSLHLVCGDLTKMFEHRIRDKNLAYSCDLPLDLPLLKADRLRLTQLLINLVDNAMKYTEKGSVAISAAPAGSLVNITVKDTGIGIALEHQERIFERFYVVDKSRSKKTGGTGLGLAIVKHIALLHNASITVHSEPGKGSSFTVSIPADTASS